MLNEHQTHRTYYNITLLSKELKVPTTTLRFWEDYFPIKVKRTRKGQRKYDIYQAHLFKNIKFLVHDKLYTIEGAKKVLNESVKIKKSR